MAAELTLGAEEEFHLIDLDSGKLAARAPQLLAKLPSTDYGAELQRTTVETNTDVVRTLDDLRAELVRLRKGVIEVAEPLGVGIAAVGTAPTSAIADFELTNTGRFGRMQEQYRMLVDEQLICGLQIHVGVADRDLGVEITQRIAHRLPVLLALSASSPYWNEHDTGYASIRSVIWQRWPSAGAPGPLRSGAEYDELLDDLIASGVIADAKMAYFDVRPSAHAPTLELRVLDACPLVDDAVAIAGLYRAAVRAAELDVEAGRPHVPQAVPLHRAGMWQAARGGLAGKLLDGEPHPRPIPASQAVRRLVADLRPQLEELGDWEQVSALTETILARGTSADRQRAAFAEHGRLGEVIDSVVRETHGPAGGTPLPPALRTYRTRAGDEAIGPAAVPRLHYAGLIDRIQEVGPEGVAARQADRERWTGEHGLQFVVDGEPRPFDVDLFPRILGSFEWSALAAGLTQRARALELFLEDVYGEQRVVRDGVVPAEDIARAAGWRDEGRHIPPGTVRAPVLGFDLVRNEFGGWRVLEDNVRTPSGVAFALAARELMDAVAPGLPRPDGLLDPHSALPLLRETLAAVARTDGSVALLSPGPGTPAWYEHSRLADGAGLLLVRPDDVDVRRGAVVDRRTGERIAVLYLRLEGELPALTAEKARPVGARILDAAAAGAVVLANAPGTGVADDKAMYCHVPALIGYYLHERPLLESVPTYRTSDITERLSVLERIGELVTKPVDGSGGAGVLIGPVASAATIAARRAEISAHPDAWVAQEVVPLSSLPTFAGTTLEPRHVDLRVFVYLRSTGPDDCRLADLALTRVAPRGSLVVNSSRGGGAKDTWIVGGAGSGSAGTGSAHTGSAGNNAGTRSAGNTGTGAGSTGTGPRTAGAGRRHQRGRHDERGRDAHVRTGG